jgi:hypothetical protein
LSARTQARLAWSLCGLTLALLAVSLLLYPRGTAAVLPEEFSTWREQAVLALGVAGAPVLGGLISSRRPENLYGWLWLGVGLGVATKCWRWCETVQPEHASLWLRPTGEGRQPVAEKRQP